MKAKTAPADRRTWFFFFFFFAASGFASLVYEVVWLRVAMAQFGVTSALTSIVLSVFMAGLALGSLCSGRLARRLGWAEDSRVALRAKSGSAHALEQQAFPIGIM